MDNEGVAFGDIFNHFRRKYHNCQLSIIHYQFVRQREKCKLSLKASLVFQAGFVRFRED